MVILGFNKIFNGGGMKNFEQAMDEGIVDPAVKAAREAAANAPPPAKKAGGWAGLPGSK
jgi:hypothetical protein